VTRIEMFQSVPDVYNRIHRTKRSRDLRKEDALVAVIDETRQSKIGATQSFDTS